MTDFDRKLLFVTGKGGVGKTTVSVALARSLAAAGRRVLLAVTEPGQVAQMLGCVPVTSTIETVTTGLSVVWLEPAAAIREYGELTLRSATLARLLVDNPYSRGFLSAIPGLHPWAALGKAWYHTTEVVDGRPRFDHVVVDGPATGHGLEMLRVPKVIRAVATQGRLRRDAERAWELLTDPTGAAVLVVTLAEELPVQESLELLEGLRQLGITQRRVVLNARLEDLFTDEQAQQLEAAARAALPERARAVLGLALRRLQSERAQQRALGRLRSGGLAPLVLPWVADAATPKGIATLAAVVTGR